MQLAYGNRAGYADSRGAVGESNRTELKRKEKNRVGLSQTRVTSRVTFRRAHLASSSYGPGLNPRPS